MGKTHCPLSDRPNMYTLLWRTVCGVEQMFSALSADPTCGSCRRILRTPYYADSTTKARRTIDRYEAEP